jgi:DNA-binding MarR family transcriptional regulator
LVSLHYYLPVADNASSDRWRDTHLGNLLMLALRRFDARVLVLMAQNVQVPLALANLAARDQVGAAHIQITRHLALEGMRLTDLAARAGMTKQAMGALVDQCEAWGLVQRAPHGRDGRAKWVRFTPLGLTWLNAFRDAVAQAEAELRAAVGDEVATVIALGLEAYAA